MTEPIAKKLNLDSKWNKIFFICRILFVALFLALFLMHHSWYMKINSSGIHLAKKRILVFAFFDLLIIFLPCIRLKVSKKLNYLLNIPMIAGSLFVTFIMGEYAMKFKFYTTALYLILINLLLLFVIFLVFYVITNRIKISLFLTYVLLIGFAIVNYFVYEFRGEPINAADLYTVGTALNVATGYTFDINWHMYIAMFSGLLLAAVLEFMPREEPFLRGKKRLLTAIPALVFSITIAYIFALSDWPADINIKVKVFNPYQCYHINGEALNFIRGFYYMKLDKPDDYTAQTAKDTMDSSGFTSDFADSSDGQTDPNVIVIMNESLTDFTTYDSVELSDDPLKFIHSLKGSSNAITGNLNVDVFGGRTANTEYEYLTGNSIAFLPANAVPYALYVRKPQPSVTWNMVDLGYCGNAAFHPYKGNGYSRPRAYPNLGFSDFISLETISDQVNKETDLVRNKTSDNSDFEWIEKLYSEERSETTAPYYMFNVTIQNHGGFLSDFDNFDQDIEVSGKFASDDSFKRYINLVDYSDEAFEKLTQYFANVDEPTIIVMFGDHRPNLHGGFFKKLYGVNPSKLSFDDMFQHYTTPLVIWANYDINEGGKYDEEFSDISINYLSSAVTELAGLPQTAYQKFLNNMREQLPVFTLHGYKDAQGNSYKVTDTSSPYYDLINEYHIYEYNYQVDTKNRNDSFFMLQSDDSAMYEYESELDAD